MALLVGMLLLCSCDHTKHNRACTIFLSPTCNWHQTLVQSSSICLASSLTRASKQKCETSVLLLSKSFKATCHMKGCIENCNMSVFCGIIWICGMLSVCHIISHWTLASSFESACHLETHSQFSKTSSSSLWNPVWLSLGWSNVSLWCVKTTINRFPASNDTRVNQHDKRHHTKNTLS